MKKASILVYTHAPMCSISCADGTREVLESSGLYDVKLIGPDSYPKIDVTRDTLKHADCLVIPGGLGDSDQFDTKMNDISAAIIGYVAEGGRYLGICMGAYFTGKHYLNLLDSADAVQYIKRPGASTTREDHDIVELDWQGEAREVYFHDGAAFVSREGKIPGSVVARYSNGDAAAIIQEYKQGKIGVIGPHPEAQKWWFYCQKRITARWHDCIQHDLILSFTKELLK